MDSIVRRSKLIVPVNNPEFMERALRCGADALILDPGNVPPSGRKGEAGALLREWIVIAARTGSDVLMLIKHDFTRADLKACVWPGLNGVVFPQAESAEEIIALDKMITELEKERGVQKETVQIDVIVQTAKGIWDIHEILGASGRVISVNIGTEEMAKDLGFEITDEVDQFAYAKQRSVVAARSREDMGGIVTPPGAFLIGIQPHGLGYLDPSTRDYSAQKKWLEAARIGYTMGFRGSICTETEQVKPLNEGFTPMEEDVEHAKKMSETMTEAIAKGLGSATMEDGKIVDINSLRPAKMLIEEVEAINDKEKLKENALKLMGKSPGKEAM
ncbi:HpcH/HpaI aldolase/citrate lyase family protein [Chloroflexota bacterium]